MASAPPITCPPDVKTRISSRSLSGGRPRSSCTRGACNGATAYPRGSSTLRSRRASAVQNEQSASKKTHPARARHPLLSVNSEQREIIAPQKTGGRPPGPETISPAACASFHATSQGPEWRPAACDEPLRRESPSWLGNRAWLAGVRAFQHLFRGHSRRSEEHTSELQSPCNLVCRLLLEKKKTVQEAPSAHCEAMRCRALRET